MKLRLLSLTLLAASLMGCNSNSGESYIKNIKIKVVERVSQEELSYLNLSYGVDGTIYGDQEVFLINEGRYGKNTRLTKTALGSEEDSLYRYSYSTYQDGSSIATITTKVGESDHITSTTSTTKSGEESRFAISYETIDAKSYLSEVIETERDGVTSYVLKLDYSNFKSGEILITQDLYNRITSQFEPIYQARLEVIPAGREQVLPDQQLMSFYPLNKHRPLLNSGLMGVYDYLIKSIVVTGTEEYQQTSTFKLNKRGRVLKQFIEYKGKFSYLNYSWEYLFDYTFSPITGFNL